MPKAISTVKIVSETIDSNDSSQIYTLSAPEGMIAMSAGFKYTDPPSGQGAPSAYDCWPEEDLSAWNFRGYGSSLTMYIVCVKGT